MDNGVGAHNAACIISSGIKIYNGGGDDIGV
jgi:hypothetical protein